jgi:hypothetical protein
MPIFLLCWCLFLLYPVEAEDWMRLEIGREELGIYLDFYSHVSHKTMVVASDVPLAKVIDLGTLYESASTGLVAMRALFLKKCGIILTDLDDKRVSVTVAGGREASMKKQVAQPPWSDLLLRNTPYAIPVPGKPGFVFSPFEKKKGYKGYIDVRGFSPGTEVKDPYTGKSFLVP